jgi:hypothetical protein
MGPVESGRPGLLSRRNGKSGYATAFSLVLGNHDSWPFLRLRLWRWFIRWGAASTERRTADDLKGVRGCQRASQRQHFAHIRSVKLQYRFLSKRSRLHRCAARGFGGGDAQWINGPLRRRDNCGERRIEQRQPNGCHADSKLIVQLRRERYWHGPRDAKQRHHRSDFHGRRKWPDGHRKALCPRAESTAARTHGHHSH